MPDPKVHDNPKARIQEAQTKNPELYRELSVYGEEGVVSPTTSKYDTSLVEGISVEQQRAEEQGFGSELLNTVGGGLLKVIPTTVGTVANILDVQNYGFFQDKDDKGQPINDYGNWLTKAMNNINQKTEEVTPIYGGSSEFGSLGNREWWMDMAKSTIESGTSFAITGMGVGAALRGVARTGAGILGETIAKANQVAVTAAAEGGANLATSALLTHAEGVQLAAGVFDNSYQIAYADFLQRNPKATHEEAQNYALHKASDAAATAHHVNMINTLLNITSINRMFTPTAFSREAAKKMTAQGLLKEWGKEGVQEYAEENINNIAENIALNTAKSTEQKSNTQLILDSIFSKEGLEAGIGGMFGGIFQSAVTDLKKGVTGEFKQQNLRYAQAQQNLQDLEKALNSVEGQQSIKTILNKANYTVDKINQINNLAIQGKDEEATKAKKELLQYQLFHAFKVGNGAQAEEMLKSTLEKLPSEERAEAHKVLAEFKEAEKVYNETTYSQPLEKQEDIYFNTMQRKNLQNDKRNLTVEKAKIKQSLIEEIRDYKFDEILRDDERAAKDVLEDAINNPNIYEKVKGLQQADELRSKFKNPVIYPSEQAYKESVMSLAKNQAELNQNILHYNAIVSGAYYEAKKKSDATEAVKNEKQTKNEQFQKSSQEYKESVEGSEAKPGTTTTGTVGEGGLEGIIAPETGEAVTTPVTETAKPEGVKPSDIETKKAEIESKRAKALESVEFAKQQNPGVDFSEDIDKINAKYDAELKALEAPIKEVSPNTVSSEVGNPKPAELSEEKTKDFKNDVKAGSVNTIGPDDPIDPKNPSNGFSGKKIVNGHNAVAIKTVATEETETGFVKISDTYLDNVNQNILSTNGVVDAGTELEIKSTKVDVKGFEVDAFGVYTPDGSLVGYIHEVSWCTEKTIAHEREELKDNVERNITELTKLREDLTNRFKAGETSVKVKITSKSSGTENDTDRVDTINEMTFSDPRVTLAVVKRDGLYVNNTSVEDFLGNNKDSLEFTPSKDFHNDYQGMTVMLLPSPKKNDLGGTVYKVQFIQKTEEIPAEIQQSIHDVVMAYLNNDVDTLNAYGVEDSKAGVQKYINQFIYTTSYNKGGYRFVVDEGVIDGEAKRSLWANTAGGAQLGRLHKETANVSDKIKSALTGRTFNLDLGSNRNGTQVRILENGKIETKIYEQLAKDQFTTNIQGMKLSNLQDEIAYFHNPVLQFKEETSPESINAKKTTTISTTIATTEAKPTTGRKAPVKPVATETEFDDITFDSPLDDEYESPEPKVYTSTKLVTDVTTGKFMDITEVEDITDTIYNFIISSYLKDDTLNPKEAIKRFQKYAQGNFEFFAFYADEANPIDAEALINKALPTHLLNATRATDWNRVVLNLQQLVPLAIEKLENSGFNLEGISDLETLLAQEYTPEKQKYGESSFEVDPVTKLSMKMKAFLKSIKSDEPNFLGEPTYVDFQSLHNKVMSLLSNKFPSYEEAVEELKKHEGKDIRRVVEKLESSDIILKNQFLTHFNKEYAEFITVKQGKTFNPNRETLHQLVYRDFSTGLDNKSATTLDNGSKKIVVSEETKILWEELRKTPDYPVELVKAYLDSVGITISTEALNYIKKYSGTPAFKREFNIKGSWNGQFGNNPGNKDNGLFGDIHALLLNNEGQEFTLEAEQTFLEFPFTAPNTGLQKSTIQKLSKVEAKYRTSDISPSFVNGEGKTFFGYTLPNVVSIRLSRLKTNKDKIVDKLKEINFTRFAVWLNQLEDANFKIFYFDVNNLTGNKDFAKSFHELSDKDKAKTRLTLFSSLIAGNYTRFISPAKSDKTKALGIQYQKFNVSFTGSQISEATYKEVAKIAYAEYHRIHKSQKNNLKAVSGYNPNHFYFFPQLNNVEALFNDGQILDNPEQAEKIILEEIKKILNDEVEYTKKQWIKYEIIKRDGIEGLDREYKEFVSKHRPTTIDKETGLPVVPEDHYTAVDYTVNQLLANYNYTALFIGDPAFFYKKNKKVFSPSVIDHIKSSIDNFFKRLAKDVAPAQRLANFEHSSINQIFINDPDKAFGKDIRMSKNFEQILSLLDGITLAQYNDLSSAKKRELKSYPYADIEAADGQEYTTLQEHLDNLYYQGQITVKEYDGLTKKINIANSLGVDVKLDKEDLKIVLKPLKPVYVYNKPDTANDMDHVFYIKPSSFPLIPGLTEGSKLDNLRKAMEKNNIHRAVMMSGAKVGAVNPLNFGDILPDSNLTSVVTILPREGYGIQQEVPYEEGKFEALQGSQIEKMIFQDLDKSFEGLKKEFDGLQMQVIDSDFQAFKEDLGIIEDESGDLSISPEAMPRFKEILEEELRSRNYNPNDIDGLRLDELNNFEIPLWFNTNATRIESLVLSMFTNRVLKQKLRGKSYVLGSELGFDYESLTDAQKSDMTFTKSFDPKQGLLAQRIVDRDGKVITDPKILQFIQNMSVEELNQREYKVKGAQVLISPFFKDAFGNTIDLRKLDLNNLPQELLECIGYRIPTQGHNSMSFIEVVGFLPENMKEMVIGSKDWTKQMGADYDVDKIFIHFNYTVFDKDNKTLVKATQESIDSMFEKMQAGRLGFLKFLQSLAETEALGVQTLLGRTDIDPELREKLIQMDLALATEEGVDEFLKTHGFSLEDFYKTKEKFDSANIEEFRSQFTDQIVKNRIIDIYKEVLSHPKTFEKIITPLGFGELENVRTELQKIDKFKEESRSVLSSWQQDQNFNTGTAGKDGTAQASLLLTFSSLLQDTKATLLSPFKILIKGLPVALKDIHSPNTIEGGRTKSEVISAFLSASVDNIKELYINTVGYNIHTHPALTTLALLGLDEYFTSYLFTQDAVKKYVDNAKENPAFEKKSATELVLEELEDVTKAEGIHILSKDEIRYLLKNPIPFGREELYEHLKVTTKDKDYYKMQLSIAMFFDKAKSTGDQLLTAQTLTNMYTAGVTNSTADLGSRLSNLSLIADNPGLTSLLGNINKVDNYGVIGIKPITPAGLGYEIARKAHSFMNKFFPYSSDLITTLQSKMGLQKKDRAKLINFIKSSLISTSEVFGGEDLRILRSRLLFGENSLAHRWDAFKKANPRHILGKRLETNLSDNPDSPSTLKYLITTGTRHDDFNIVKTLIEMLNNPETSALAEDTIKYQLVNGGIQLPNNFVKLIANDYLIQNNFGKGLINRMNDPLNTKNIGPIIEKQFYQHYPETLSPLVEGAYENEKIEYLENGAISIESDRSIGDYAFIKFKEGSELKDGLYQRTEKRDARDNFIYVPIPLLGKGSIIEASTNQPYKQSVFPENNPGYIFPIDTPEKKGPIISLPENEGTSATNELGLTVEKGGIDHISEVLSNIEKTSEVPQHKILAKIFNDIIDLVDPATTMQLVPGLTAGGRYNRIDNTIVIKPKENKKELERTVLHEILHALTVNATINKDLLPIKAQEALTSLERLYESAKKKYEQKHGPITDFKQREVYGFKNIREFITETLTHPAFQDTLSNLEFTEKKSVIGRFKELMSKLYSALTDISDFYLNDRKVKSEYVDEAITNIFDILNVLSEEKKAKQKGLEKRIEETKAPDTGFLEGLITEEDVYESPLEDSPFTTDPDLVTMSSNIKKFIDNLELRLRKVKDLAFNEKDRLKKEKLRERVDTLEDQLEKLTTTKQAMDLVSMAKENIDYVSQKLDDPSLSLGDINELKNTLNVYNDFVNSLLTEVEKEKIEDVNKKGEVVKMKSELFKQAEKVERKYNRTFDKFQKVLAKNCTDQSNKDQGTNLTEEEMIGPVKDINNLEAYLRTASTAGNFILSWINNIRLFAIKRADREIQNLLAKERELVNNLKNSALFKARGWEILFQEGSERNLVNQYSAKYWNEVSNYYDNLKSGKPELIKRALDWYRNNMEIIDLNRIVVNGVVSDIKLAEYKKELGDKAYLVDEAIDKYNIYKDFEAQKIGQINTETSDVDKRRIMLLDWQLENSPLIAARRIKEGLTQKLVSGKFPKYSYYEFFTATPKEGRGFHDKNYDLVQSDPILKAYYEFANTHLGDFFKMAPQSYIVNNKIKKGLIPYVQRTWKEKMAADGAMGMLHGGRDWLVNKTATTEDSTIVDTEFDPETGEYARSLPVTLLVGKEYKAYSRDLSHIMQESIKTFVMYKHKSLVEDKLLAARSFLNQAEEDRSLSKKGGDPASFKQGLKNTKMMADFIIDVFYDKKNKKEFMTGKKFRTAEEQKEFERLADLILEKESKVEQAKPLEKVKLKEDIKKAKEEQVNLGKNISFGQILRSLVNFNALKTQAFNIVGPAVELIGGQITNLSHAASGLDFNTDEYWFATKKIFGLDKKTAKILRRFNVVKNPFETDGTLETWEKTLTYLNEQTDLKTRGVSAVAVMANTKIAPEHLKSGKSMSFYEALDENGDLTQDMFTEEGWKLWNPDSLEINNFSRLEVKINTLNDKLFGSYNPDNPLMIKRTVAGSALSQFKTFIIEGWYSRFESERESYELGRKTKGRYRSYADLFAKEGGAIGTLKAVGMGMLFSKTAFDKLSPIDQANMKKNIIELYFILGISGMVQLLGLALAGEDDDEDQFSALTLLYNTTLRVQSDLMYYINPNEAKSLNERAIPLFQLYSDVTGIRDATLKLIEGDNEVQKGSLRGMNIFLKEGLELFPVSSAMLKLYKQSHELINK